MVTGVQTCALPISLFVIDGIPIGTTSVDPNKNGADFGNLLSQLNSEDIASISILKGASAGALYGSAAGNGVIMITTKSGKGGKAGIGVSVNSSIIWDKPYNFFTTQLLYGDGIRASSIIHQVTTGGPNSLISLMLQ